MTTTNGTTSTTPMTGDAAMMYGKAYAGSPNPTSSQPLSYEPLDVQRYLSPYGARREPSALRALVPIMAIPGMISLGGGMPNPRLFPFESQTTPIPDSASVTVRMKDGFEWRITSEDKTEMIDAFQYSGTVRHDQSQAHSSAGIDPLLTELRNLQQREHNPPLPDNAWSVAVTNGSQDGLAKVLEMLVGEGDTVLTETPTYSGALSILRPLCCTIVGLPCDGDGLIPAQMRERLTNWNETTDGRRPRILYAIPTGQNPAGSTLTAERRREIYEICCDFDLLILEDDPYYFLHYGHQHAPPAGHDHLFSRPHQPSLWSLDVQGRVIRFDSLSKVFSSGLRLGYVTGPVGFVNAMLLCVQATNLHSAGIAQVMAYKFMQHLGDDGWKRHVTAVSLFYARRRDQLISYCDKYLQGLVEYTVPSAGMFVWFKLCGVADSKVLIETEARKALVLLVPGQVFMPNGEVSNYVRASFSLATEADMEIAMQRLATVLRAAIGHHGNGTANGTANGGTH